MTTTSGREDSPTYDDAGRQLAELRRRHGFSQERLADAIAAYLGKGQDRAGQRAVSTWERGVSRPPVPKLAAIAAITGADPADLLLLWYPELAAATLDNVHIDVGEGRRLEFVHELPQDEHERLRAAVVHLARRFDRRATTQDVDEIVDALLALPEVETSDG